MKPAAAGPVKGPWALPETWRWERLDDVAPVNPSRSLDGLDDNAAIAFVPMAAVEAETGRISIISQRQVKLLRQGFTRFAPGDVIFAKITPCMENGKLAVVPDVPNGIACGSTEFHVLKPETVQSRYLYYWLSQKSFREEAEFNMTGTAGQKRVPTSFIRHALIPVPPRLDQDRIIARIDSLFTDLEDGEAALARARTDLGTWRKSLLKAAITGELTADWRAANSPAETGADLLARILDERRTRWVAEPCNRGKRYVEPAEKDHKDLPMLPAGWTWVAFEQVIEGLRNGISIKPNSGPPGIPILRISSVRAMGVTDTDHRWLPADFQTGSSIAKSGDLLFTRYNGSPELVGVCGMYRGVSGIAYPDKVMCAPPAQATSSLGDYLEIALNAGASRAHIKSYTKTSAGQHGVSGETVKRTPVPLPPTDEIEEIVRRFNSISEQASEGGVETDMLATVTSTLRQSILAAAFRGKLVR